MLVMGCWDHPVHSKGIDQAQGPFRGSHQEQKETGPETKVHPGDRAELSATDKGHSRKRPPHRWDLLSAQGPSPHPSSERPPLPKHLQVSKSRHLNLVTTPSKQSLGKSRVPSFYPARSRKADPVAG